MRKIFDFATRMNVRLSLNYIEKMYREDYIDVCVYILQVILSNKQWHWKSSSCSNLMIVFGRCKSVLFLFTFNPTLRHPLYRSHTILYDLSVEPDINNMPAKFRCFKYFPCRFNSILSAILSKTWTFYLYFIKFLFWFAFLTSNRCSTSHVYIINDLCVIFFLIKHPFSVHFNVVQCSASLSPEINNDRVVCLILRRWSPDVDHYFRPRAASKSKFS